MFKLQAIWSGFHQRPGGRFGKEVRLCFVLGSICCCFLFTFSSSYVHMMSHKRNLGRTYKIGVQIFSLSPAQQCNSMCATHATTKKPNCFNATTKKPVFTWRSKWYPCHSDQMCLFCVCVYFCTLKSRPASHHHQLVGGFLSVFECLPSSNQLNFQAWY